MGKITKKHQRRYVARHIYISSMRNLTQYVAHLPEYRSLFHNVERVQLKVFADNVGARQFYETVGFRVGKVEPIQNLPHLNMLKMEASIDAEGTFDDSDGYEHG